MATNTKKVIGLGEVISEARKIRHGLVAMRKQYWKENRLAGACGLASILLSIAVQDVTILRGTPSHIWTEIKGTIVDITATQFNYYRTYARDPKVRGVLVTKEPRGYHEGVTTEGMNAYLLVINGNWYNENDHPCWRWISEYWL